MGVFSTPKVKPDPAAQAAVLRQQQLADTNLTNSFQTGLMADTRTRLREFGVQPGTANYGTSSVGGGGNGVFTPGGGRFPFFPRS